MAKVSIAELRLGDVIDLGFTPWGSAIVKQVTETDVTWGRPYAITEDIACGDKVICYIGIEEGKFSRSSPHQYELVQKGNVIA